jgi:small GTP-binding protein
MLGAFAVGKTSLVSRFVRSIFSEDYKTTVGVKIDKCSVVVDGTDLNLIVWDLHGEDEFQHVRTSYLRGSSGYLLVADGTRRETLATVEELQARAEETIGRVPFLLVLNKSDLGERWEITDEDIVGLEDRGWVVFRTSAKTGGGVAEAFESLASKMLSS